MSIIFFFFFKVNGSNIVMGFRPIKNRNPLVRLEKPPIFGPNR